MLQILGFRAPGKANLPRTFGRHCRDLVPTFRAGCFFEIDSSSLLEFFWYLSPLSIFIESGCSVQAGVIHMLASSFLNPRRVRRGHQADRVQSLAGMKRRGRTRSAHQNRAITIVRFGLRGKNLGHSDLDRFYANQSSELNFPFLLGKNGPNSEERGIYTNPS